MPHRERHADALRTSSSRLGYLAKRVVPVFALGAGQKEFNGYYDNTDIYKKLALLTKIKKD